MPRCYTYERRRGSIDGMQRRAERENSSRALQDAATAGADAAAGPQNIPRWMPSVVSTVLAISSIDLCVVLSTGMRSARNRASAAATSRSEEHPSELQSLMRISYAVFCLKKKKQTKSQHQHKIRK